MSQKTRIEVLAKKRDRYARQARNPNTKIINELFELFDYHREAAIRARRARPVIAAPFVLGRPKEVRPGPTARSTQSHLAGRAATRRRAAQGVPARLAARVRGGAAPPQRRRAQSPAGSQPRQAGPAADSGADRAPPPGHHASGHPVAPPDSDQCQVDRAPGGLSDDGHGGHLVKPLPGREAPMAFTHSRQYHKNDLARLVQKNCWHVRLRFG